MTKTLQVWGVRLWLGALFLFGSEILVWLNTAQHSPLDWVIRAVGYTLLATLILDLAVRFRVRDVYDTMALIAIFALLAAVLIAPNTSFVDFPRTLLTRVLGAYGLVGLEMFGWLLVMTNARDRRMRRLLLPAVAWNGFYWGIWMRWMPVFNPTFTPISLSDVLLFAVVLFGIACVIGFFAQSAAKQLQPLDFRLSLVGFLLMAASGMVFLIGQALANQIQLGSLLACAALVGVSWAILWFRRTDKEPMLLDAHFRATPRNPLWIAASILVFLIVCVVAYNLPLLGDTRINQLWIMEIGYGAVGALWYPLVAVVLAMRGIDRQMRTEY